MKAIQAPMRIKALPKTRRVNATIEILRITDPIIDQKIAILAGNRLYHKHTEAFRVFSYYGLPGLPSAPAEMVSSSYRINHHPVMVGNDVDPEYQPPRVPEKLRRTIMGMKRPRGWRGSSALAIREEACSAAIRFFEAVTEDQPDFPEPEVSPSPRGGITLTWWFGDRGFLVRVFGSGPVYYQQEGPGYQVQSGTEDRKKVLQKMRALAQLAAQR